MSNLPLDNDLKRVFEEVTANRSESEPPVRAILVQNDGGTLRLIDSLPPAGSDRDDFNDVLGKLFAAEPTRPGYALFRLDSRSPAGLYEWINCAFRPEGAKVREKMQYTVTQASLFQGLSEQHFLETVYASSVSEFAFPSRLRNSRKHDYQNPQQSIRGKAAAEAAGTDAGGARRNFDSVAARPTSTSASARTPSDQTDVDPQHVTAVSTPQPSVTAEVKDSASVSDEKIFDTRPAQSSAPPIDASAISQVSETKAEQELTTASKDGMSRATERGADGGAGQHNDTTSKTASSLEQAANDAESTTAAPLQSNEEISTAPLANDGEKAADVSAKPNTVASEADARPLVTESSAPIAVAAALTKESDNAMARDVDDGKQPAIAEIAPSHASSTELTSDGLKAANAPQSDSTKATGPVSSIGLGTGAQGLETEREKELANLKAEESRYKSGASAQQGAGGPNTGFAWHSAVEPSLDKLGDGSGVNMLVLKLDLREEEVQVASGPRSVEPSNVASALEGSGSNEPRYAFYAHPQAQHDAVDGVSNIGLIYLCPSNSTVRQRMLYSVNLAVLSSRVDSLAKLKISKRAETSDASDLTADFLSEALVGPADGQESTSPAAAGFTRPKRPGRK